MIGFLRGKLIAKTPPQLLLDVQGVGYEVEAPMTTFYDLPQLGEEVQLFTHLVIRDDAHILFAFSTEADKTLFRLLIKVNGVGPKMALTILSGQSSTEFRRCIHDNDIQTLIRLPGVGKKTAERLVIEMRDRLPESSQNEIIEEVQGGLSYSTRTNPKQEAISALCALGYKSQDAHKMVKNLSSEIKSCEEIIKLALQGSLSR